MNEPGHISASSFIHSRFPVLRGKTRPVCSIHSRFHSRRFILVNISRGIIDYRGDIHEIHEIHVQIMFIHGASG